MINPITLREGGTMAPETTEDQLRATIKELEARLSTTVSARDLTIRDLRTRVAELERALAKWREWGEQVDAERRLAWP